MAVVAALSEIFSIVTRIKERADLVSGNKDAARELARLMTFVEGIICKLSEDEQRNAAKLFDAIVRDEARPLIDAIVDTDATGQVKHVVCAADYAAQVQNVRSKVMDADELKPVGSGAPPFPTKSLAPVRWSTAEGALERRHCCENTITI